MKKILIVLLFLLGGLVAHAQYAAPVDGPLTYKLGGIYDANGHRLTRSEGNTNYFLTPEQQRLFNRGRSQYFWGAGMIVGSVAMMSIAASVGERMEAGSSNISQGELYIWSATIMSGIPILIAGNVLFFSGRHKLKDATQNYNYYRQKGQGISLSYGPQKYGYGLALTF